MPQIPKICIYTHIFLQYLQVCKRAPLVAYEAMECHGGNGYVDEAPIARLFRQAPLNAIWEGSGNVSLGIHYLSGL